MGEPKGLLRCGEGDPMLEEEVVFDEKRRKKGEKKDT